MTRLSTQQQQVIAKIVTPERARFDLDTRDQFSRDAGLQPRLGVLNGRILPDAVVWPEEEWEIASLVEFASSSGLPIVPRGGGTGIYGGAVPVDGGILVDLTRLSGVVDVNREEDLATVRAGSRWTQVESELQPYGLATCVYPTSAPTATVGGWLAQGGAGLGSYAFGRIDDNVEAVRVVGGDGQIHELQGYDLDCVAGAEGTTGILTEVLLRVRPATAETSALLGLPDAASLEDALRSVANWELPVWSATFVNAHGAARLNNARGLDDSGPGNAAHLPGDQFVLHLVFSSIDADRVAEALREIEALTAGRRLADELAQREWANRFRPLRSTFASGSTAPAEVVIPTYNLTAVLQHLERSIGSGLAIEGTLIDGWQTVLRVFPSSAAPALSQTSQFSLTFDVLGVAGRHGGHGYSTGRYLGTKAGSIMGSHRLEFLRNTRAWLDPAGVMNPGKVVFGNALIGQALLVTAGVQRLRRSAQEHGR